MGCVQVIWGCHKQIKETPKRRDGRQASTVQPHASYPQQTTHARRPSRAPAIFKLPWTATFKLESSIQSEVHLEADLNPLPLQTP